MIGNNTMTISISAKDEADITARAKALGLNKSAYVRNLLSGERTESRELIEEQIERQAKRLDERIDNVNESINSVETKLAELISAIENFSKMVSNNLDGMEMDSDLTKFVVMCSAVKSLDKSIIQARTNGRLSDADLIDDIYSDAYKRWKETVEREKEKE